MTKQGVRLRVVPLLVLAALVIGTAFPAAALAASAFNGGPDLAPTYVHNDHTPIAVHFVADAASGLASNTVYSVKVRYTVGTSPSPTTNRGWTWNPATNEWVQERDVRSWAAFPTITTDGNGAISSNQGWVFTKFGDETITGPYHLMISLSATTGATFNASLLPTVTVIDPRVDGGWVHNGVAYNQNNTRAVITDVASTTVLSVSKTENNLVDSDSDGTVDNENWGPDGNTADFWMSVPASTTIGVNLKQLAWAPGAGFVTGPADVDLAIGASDTVAPSAPGVISGTSGDSTATLAWTSAFDNEAVAGYYVYRWVSAPAGAAYSAVHSRVATLAAGVTSFDDSALTNGVEYNYEVRAFDASTNVGPRSTVVTLTPAVARPEAAVMPAGPDGNDGWYVTTPTVTLTTVSGRTSVYSFDASPSVWTTYTGPIEVPNGISTLTYRDTDGAAVSATGTLDFKVDTSLPVAELSAPAFPVPASRDRNFEVSWTGTDTVAGVAVYDVEYRKSTTGTWTAWRASTAETSAVFPGAAGANYYFRARVRDGAGNESGWTAVAQTVVPYNQSKASFSSSWRTTTNSSQYLGSAMYTFSKGGSASVKFTKGTLYLVAKTGPTMGKMAVYYKGKKIGTVDLHSSTTKYRQTFKLISRSSGTKAYTVRLVNMGVSGHRRVEVDGFAFKQ